MKKNTVTTKRAGRYLVLVSLLLLLILMISSCGGADTSAAQTSEKIPDSADTLPDQDWGDDNENPQGHVHAWGDWEIVKAATHTEQGDEKRSCSCGEVENRLISAKGHDYKSAVTQPTCTEKGYTTYTCACGASYIDNYVNAKGHSYTAKEENGQTVYTCPCGHSYVVGQPEPAKGTKIRVTYLVNDAYAGSIQGQTTQDVYYGQTATKAVSVTANLGYKFVGWSDGSTAVTRENECPKANATYTAIFEFDALELPILDLRTDSGLDITSKEVYVRRRNICVFSTVCLPW